MSPASRLSSEIEEPMLHNIMYVTLYVSDQDKALAFYTDALGLEKRADHSGPERPVPDRRRPRESGRDHLVGR